MFASSSHFIGRPMPILHAHRRRVSAQYVDRSVVVGVGTETAMSAGKDRLAFAALPVNGSALRARLRRICRVDQHKRAAPLFEFVGKDGGECSPTLVQDTAVKPGLLSDLTAWLLSRPARGACHVFDLQVFDDDSAKPIGNRSTDLVVPIAADAGATSREFCHTSQLFASAVGPLLSACEDLLRRSMQPFDGIEACRQGQVFTRRQHKGCGHATINADRRAYVGRYHMLNLASETDMPTSLLGSYCDILDLPGHGSRVAKFYPSDLRKLHLRPFAIKTPDLNLAPEKTKRVIGPFPARFWITGSSCKKVLEGSIKIANSLLGASLRDVLNPVIFRAQCGEFSTLFSKIYAVGSAPYLTLFQGQIVHQAANASELPELAFLAGRRR